TRTDDGAASSVKRDRILLGKIRVLWRDAREIQSMKPKSVFLAENTNLEIEAFLKEHHTLYVPVGAMEQHGPHSAIGTDVFIPQEIARRVCEKQGNALV